MILSEVEHDKIDAIEEAVMDKVRKFSEAKGHEFSNGSQRIMTRELIVLIHKHLKEGAYAHLDKKNEPADNK